MATGLNFFNNAGKSLSAFQAYRFVLLFLAGSLMLYAHAEASNYDFNSNCRLAYKQILSLEFAKAQQTLAAEKARNSDNLIPVLLENYIDFLTLTIGEEINDFERLKANRTARLNILSAGDAASPWHRHAQASINLQWAFARVKFGEYITAGLELNRAYRLLQENKSLHPAFPPDLLLGGVLQALIGSIPQNYHWAIRLAGLEGSVEEGRRLIYALPGLQSSGSEWSYLNAEAFFYLSFIEINLSNDKEQINGLLQMIESSKADAHGALFCYIRANLNNKSGRSEQAISVLENCEISPGSYPFHYLSLIRGVAMLQNLDPGAMPHLLNYVNHYRGINYIKSAYRYLAWLALINNDSNAYRFYMSEVLKNGNTFVDEDKQAEAEAKSGEIPNIVLLKARLLFDGGQYQRALLELNSANSLSLKSQKDSVEFVYRKARIHHEAGNPAQATIFYKQTIIKGKNQPWFFAGNAALQLGLLYESEGDYDNALLYFDECLKMRFTEYRSSIQQKAAVGKQRVSAKK